MQLGVHRNWGGLKPALAYPRDIACYSVSNSMQLRRLFLYTFLYTKYYEFDIYTPYLRYKMVLYRNVVNLCIKT